MAKIRPIPMVAENSSMYEVTELRRPFLHYQAGENPMYDVTELRRQALCYHRRVQAMRPRIQYSTNEHEKLISAAQAASARLDLTALKAAYLAVYQDLPHLADCPVWREKYTREFVGRPYADVVDDPRCVRQAIAQAERQYLHAKETYILRGRKNSSDHDGPEAMDPGRLGAWPRAPPSPPPSPPGTRQDPPSGDFRSSRRPAPRPNAKEDRRYTKHGPADPPEAPPPVAATLFSKSPPKPPPPHDLEPATSSLMIAVHYTWAITPSQLEQAHACAAW